MIVREFPLKIFTLTLPILALWTSVVFAAIEIREFSTEENRETFHNLTKELRCPKCQNQDIADSNAPIAKDMRQQVHRLVEEGKSHDQVVDYMIERFGEFVTYKPKVSSETLVLWYGPWVLIAVGGIVIAMLAYRKRGSTANAKISSDKSAETAEVGGEENSPQSPKQSPEQEQRLRELLEKYGDD
jgi:cytochrome c-type biogenesis protein CcmH